MAKLPSLPTYLCGVRRKVYLSIAAVVISLAIIAIALGAALGGKKGTKGSQTLPLPGNSQPHTGDLTYYAPGLGACGVTSNDTEHIVAVSHTVFDAVQMGKNPNTNPLCGQMIRATHTATNGTAKTVDLKVVDRCVGCKPTDLDITQPTFNYIAPDGNGRTNVTWFWLD